MTAPDDLDRQLDAYLWDGPTALPDPSFDAVRDRVEMTSQRAVIGPWRLPIIMNKLVPIGLGAAAVIAVLVIGSQLLGPAAPSGVGAAPPSAAPSAASSPTAEPSIPPSPSPEAALPLGPHALSYSGSVVPMTVTIPAPGWGGEGGILVKNENADPPDGAGMIVFAEDIDWRVPSDPCSWSTTMPDTGAATVDELVTALAGQTGRNASAPEDITIGGYNGKSITLRVPDDAVLGACDGGKFCSLAAPELSPSDPCYRYHQGAGQIDTFWIVDVDGVVVIIDSAVYADTRPGDAAEMEAIVRSTVFE